MPYTISDMKQANENAGHHFFDRKTIRFFDSAIDRRVYEGPGGVYFVTSEKSPFPGSRRLYSVRQFNPVNGHVWTVGEFQRDTTLEDARDRAKAAASFDEKAMLKGGR